MASKDSIEEDVAIDTRTPEDTVDPISSNFDPLAALCAPSIPGLVAVDPLQNIQEYEDYQSNPELFLRLQAERKEKDALRKAAKLKSAADKEAMTSAPRPKRLVKNVITRMNRIEGPTALLQRWIQSRTKVKVITRSFKSVRGTCSGFIVAFDRYMNLAMVDVDETYCSIHTDKSSKTKPAAKKQTTSGSTEASSSKVHDAEMKLLVRRVDAMHVTPSTNIQHRHLKQLFIRGDNVVSVSCCF